MTRHLPTILMFLVLGAGTAFAREDATPVAPPFREVESPAAPGSGEPFLCRAPDGTVLLSWVEPGDAGMHRLRFAAWKDAAWGTPATVAEGDDWFVNWADVPSVVAAGDGRMAAHWLVKADGGDGYAYDIRVAQSFDGGATWGAPVTPHTDGTAAEHGFVSLVYTKDGLHAVWLDGRKYADEGAADEMTLRTARIGRDGRFSGEAELDARTCDCCPTAVAAVDDGFVVAYRDRSAEEIRDISVVRYAGGAWESPRPVADDGWKIEGCPVNGPALVSSGNRVAIVWFTMDGEAAVVKGAWSEDGGRRFGASMVLSDAHAVGRVMAAMADGRALAGWLSEDSIDIRPLAARATSPRRVASTNSSRSSGYPRVAAAGGNLLVAWTQPGDPSRVRVAVAGLDALWPAPGGQR